MKTGSTATPTSKTRTNRRTFLRVALALLLAIASACAAVQGPGSGVPGPNVARPAPPGAVLSEPQASRRAVLILISLDGWRWDYLDRAQAPRLRALARMGVRSEGLIPPFPSKTFPSHTSIVTGLRPEHHGIVSNNMRDAKIGERFSMSAATALDTRWWEGEPLWVTAETQGVKSASMFWPGSDVEIKGVRPSHWKKYDGDFPNRERVQQVLSWLRLPEAERPRFITLYFSDVDHMGHERGPDSTEVLEAAAELDREVGALIDGVNALRLQTDVHYVVVSDHGMSATSTTRLIPLDDFIDPATVDLVDVTPVLGIWPRTITVEDAYRALKDKHPRLAIYKREDIPAELHFRNHPRIPPVIGIADDGWTVTSRGEMDEWQRTARRMGGNHGYDPRHRSMHGLFIAHGPEFRMGVRLPAFENIHLYEMMARLLGLKPAPNDGRAEVTRSVFR